MKQFQLLLPLAVIGLAVPARSAVTIDVTQSGGNVVFTVSGSLDLDGATLVASGPSYGPGFIADGSNWWVGPGPGDGYTSYAMTAFAGDFGTSGDFQDNPSSLTGDDFFIWGDSGLIAQVGVSGNYESGESINSGMVFDGTTIAALNMTPGSYVYNIPNDSITLDIGSSTSSVPDSGATLTLLGSALAAIAVVRRRRA
jgi:hypothetical protein